MMSRRVGAGRPLPSGRSGSALTVALPAPAVFGSMLVARACPFSLISGDVGSNAAGLVHEGANDVEYHRVDRGFGNRFLRQDRRSSRTGRKLVEIVEPRQPGILNVGRPGSTPGSPGC